MYSRGAFSPTTTTAQQSLFRADTFSSNGSMALKDGTTLSEAESSNHSFGAGPADSAALLPDGRPAPAIMIRKLPRTTSDDTLMSMLIFAGDLIDTEFVRSPYPDDHGFATAVARFRSQAGAIDAQQKLNGKTNTTKEANMIVELHSSGMSGAFERRGTIDGNSHQRTTGSSSSGTSGPTTSRSRFGSTFQSTDKISPPLVTSSSSGSGNEFPVPDSKSHFQTLFSPQSPLANGFDEPNRISGKSIINDGGADDETGELLKDPLAYAKNGQKSSTSSARRPTVPHLPIGRFNSLSLSSSNGSGLPSPNLNGMTSPRASNALQSPLSPTSLNGMSSNPPYSLNYPRPQYPPVNPADQNPPCNTLYVGNLPIDASEDELKAIFSKQRGYKRLCFRTKQNGPMCFVEFEDVSFATKALNELYGHPLHNSVKGGIRLSFSKNPLGVRSGQTSGLPNNNNAVSPQGMNAGYVSGMSAAMGFSGVSGPPPGLMAPPGLANGAASAGSNSTGQQSPPPLTNLNGAFPNAFGLPTHGFNEQLSPRNLSGGLPPNMSGHYGRDGRGPYNDYMLGR